MFDTGFWELALLSLAFKTSHDATLGWDIGVQADNISCDQVACL